MAKKSFIIDTPGIRSLDFLEFNKYELLQYFPEFENFSNNCKFRDCLHFEEPDCAVKKAVEDGIISETRYKSYLRLLNEIN